MDDSESVSVIVQHQPTKQHLCNDAYFSQLSAAQLKQLSYMQVYETLSPDMLITKVMQCLQGRT